MAREFTPVHRPPAGGEYYVFRDAVHNLIEIEDAAEGVYIRQLLGKPELQRLRHIRQNGMNFFVYASQESSRFPHSLGSFHIARRLISALKDRQPAESEGFPKKALGLYPRDCFAFSVAALLHDIGHGPLSHTWEEIWATPRNLSHFHERMGKEILKDTGTNIGAFLSDVNGFAKYPNIGEDIISFIENKHRLNYLYPLLSGNLDVDRLDFMARDTRSAGVSYGFHDLDWIIRSLRFALLPAKHTGEAPQWIVAIDARKGLSTLVQFLHARENMYRLVYHHKTTRAATCMLRLLFKRASELAKRGQLTAIDQTPCRSPALYSALTADDLSPDAFLQLDDSDVWVSLKHWAAQCNDQIIRDLANGIINRHLYKVFLLSEPVYNYLIKVDTPEFGDMLARTAVARLGCGLDMARYFYTFDKTDFDIIGREAKRPVDDVWIMESGSLGLEYRTLRQYWTRDIGSLATPPQYLLTVHEALVEDLDAIVKRLSFPDATAKAMDVLPVAPDSYKVLGALGRSGAHKEVYVGALSNPGDAPESLVALKLYKVQSEIAAAVEHDAHIVNLLLADDHPNLAQARVIRGPGGELWIRENLWVASLEELVTRHGRRTDLLEIFDISVQLFNGLAALHGRRLRHTDIKPDNCGIVHGRPEQRRYVLGDFGCLSASPEELPTGRLRGTLRTMAPEVIAQTEISLASDVWAMGATIYSLCALRYPFLPFNTPHDDGDGRAAREVEIRQDLASKVEEFRNRVVQELPPVLAQVLDRCFLPAGIREGADEIRNLLDQQRQQLVGADGLSRRWAWQQAESILQLYRSGQIGGTPDNDHDLVSESRSILNNLGQFVPKILQEELREFLDSSAQ